MIKDVHIKHIIRTVIITLLAGYFGLIAVLNLPFIQRELSDVATRELSKLLQTEVRIGNINLGLLNRIIIQNVYVNDRSGRELCKISRLSAKFELTPLLHGKVRISSVQLFGLNAHISRPTPQAETNLQFILDTFASKDTTQQKRDIDLRINSVLIRRGEVNYDVESEPQTAERFNPNHVSLQNLSATLSLKALTPDSLNMQVRRMSFSEGSGFKVRRLAMKVTGNRRAFSAHQVELGLPESSLEMDTLWATYGELKNLFAMQAKSRYAVRLRASITPRDLRAFVPALEHFKDAVNFSLALEGEGDRVECPHFELYNADRSMWLQAKGLANHLCQKEKLFLFGDISELEVSQRGSAWLLRNLTGREQTPDLVRRLGNIRFKGDVSGLLHQLTTYGKLTTQIGALEANVTMYTDTATDHRSYSGKVTSSQLDLGILTNRQEALGKAAFDLELKGFKYKDGEAKSYVKGMIHSLTYNQYEYKHIGLDGHYQSGGFNGRVTLNDPNGNIDIEGSFATHQQMPEFNLRASIRNLRPHTLHLTPKKFQNMDFSVDVTADFKGNSIDDVTGRVSVENLSVQAPEKEGNFFMDKLLITAETLKTDSSVCHATGLQTGYCAKGDKQIRLSSPFLNGEVTGHYSYRTILTSIQRMLRNYVPALLKVKKELPPTENNFCFRLKAEDSRLYREVLGLPLTLNMPVSLSGSINDPKNRIRLKGYLPEFVYNDSFFESGVLLCDNTDEELQCQLRLHKRMKKGAMVNLAAYAHVKDNTLRTTLNWGNNTSATFSGKVEATARFEAAEQRGELATQIQIHPSEVILNDVTWRVHPAEVKLKGGCVEINDFLFEHGDQYVKAHGIIGPEEQDSCLVDLNHIDLQYVMELIQFHAVDFNGLASGKAYLHHLLKDPVMHTRLHVQDFKLNHTLLGQADIQGRWDNERGAILLNADIRENEHYSTRVDGYISPKEKGLDLHIQAGGTNLAFLHKFVYNIFDDIQGRAFGKVRLFGPFAQLDLEGQAKANASVKVGILNTYFHAQTDSVNIRSGNFTFKDVTISDSEGHTGRAAGELNHRKLKDLAYSFRFDTRNMLVYHTEKATPDFPFYGKIYSTGNVLLQGGNNTLTVDGNMRADSQTSFTYVTATAAEATSNQFITFVDKTPKRRIEEEEVDADIYHYLNRTDEKEAEAEVETDIHLNLQIEATPTAKMCIVMDPLAGDNISARGTGNLQINFYNKGNFQIFGNYNIEEGIYKMSLQNVIRKDFTLQPGGIVSFNGDPTRANLNVQAVYTVTSASLNDLAPDAASNKGTVRVNCLLNLSGNLTAPTLHFDLDLPTVSDEDRELVRSLTNTEEQMNTQIIYLLSIGKFYTYDYANNANQSDATSSLAFSTLSGQLNNMLSQVIDSQNWNFGTNLSTGEKGWSDVEAEAILSGRLLNNRLIINGNFGYRDNPMRNTNFVGDFEAMWLLTKNGEFRLKGYNQTNDRYFTKSTLTTQGIGLMYKKDFTNWRELVDWLMLKNRRNRKKTEKERNRKVQPEAAAEKDSLTALPTPETTKISD